MHCWCGVTFLDSTRIVELVHLPSELVCTRANFDRGMFTFAHPGARGSEHACPNVTLNFGLVSVPFRFVSFRFTVSVPGFIVAAMAAR